MLPGKDLGVKLRLHGRMFPVSALTQYSKLHFIKCQIGRQQLWMRYIYSVTTGWILVVLLQSVGNIDIPDT